MATETGGTVDRIRDRLGFDHSHSYADRAIVLAFAALLALYAAWLFADIVPRFLSFLVVAVGGTYALYACPTRRGVVVRGLYGLAILIVATPFWLSLSFLLLPYGTGQVETPIPFVFTVADVVFVVVFGLFAAVPAGIAAFLEWRR